MALRLLPTLLVLSLPGLTACAAPLPRGGRADAPALVTASAVAPAGGARLPSASAHEDDIARLASEDFVTRQRAAERLVRAGEGALPALGAAGRGEVRGLGGTRVRPADPVIAAILEDLEPDQVRSHLAGPWPAVRRVAAEDLGARGRLGVVPDLISRLEDEDVEVRVAAASSLRRLTRRYFGYAPRGTLVARREAEGRWRDWWRVEGRRQAGREGGDSG